MKRGAAVSAAPDKLSRVVGLFGEDGLALIDLWDGGSKPRCILDVYGRGEAPAAGVQDAAPAMLGSGRAARLAADLAQRRGLHQLRGVHGVLGMPPHTDARFALLNCWQRNFPPSLAPIALALELSVDDVALAVLLEDGLPLVERPYGAWAEALGRTPEQLLARLERWLRQGALRRYGIIVRYHESGFAHNAMTVFHVPDECVDACDEALAYFRERAEGWPFKLYGMVHGHDRVSVQAAIYAAIGASGLGAMPRAELISRRRFKQRGSAHFHDWCIPEREACLTA